MREEFRGMGRKNKVEEVSKWVEGWSPMPIPAPVRDRLLGGSWVDETEEFPRDDASQQPKSPVHEERSSEG
jgi:hypothetical protein